jgi:peroxiredoxin
LPERLPPPVDDGAADHLAGTVMPPVALGSTNGDAVGVDVVPDGAARLVLYAHPWIGRPGEDPLAPNWDLIPGARGCTPESCGFRDHAAELRETGAAVVGLSTQDAERQREAAARLRLPFPLLSDAELVLTRALRLPVFEAAGHTLLKRLTLIVTEGVVEHCFYPVFPPDRHAVDVLAWLRSHPPASG